MTVIHFSTEVSGGAGDFVRNLHLAMNRLNMPSLLLSRERKDISGLITLKPMSRIAATLRARGLTALAWLGVLNSRYAIFGVEPSPVLLGDIQNALGSRRPTAFVFYWTSYFVNFETILTLRRAYPTTPCMLVCLDEAFLTGACHYSFGCTGYHTACSKCPATTLGVLQSKIERNFQRKKAAMREIDPIIVYPTTAMRTQGELSAALQGARSCVIPLGAMTDDEWRQAMEARRRYQGRKLQSGAKAVLLIRSSNEYRKGCDLLISALKTLSRRCPDLRSRFEIISIGDETLLTARIDEYIDHTAMGYVNRDELISLYTRVDALLVTSREDAGPLMINECVALGVFVISTPIGVAGDLITSDSVGRISRDTGEEALADSLESFLDAFSKRVISAQPTLATRPALTFESYIKSLVNLLSEKNATIR